MNDTPPVLVRGKKPKWTGRIFSIIGLAITASIVRVCQQQQWEQQEAKQPSYRTTVWVPGYDGRMTWRSDVEVLERGPAFLKFRTADGEIIEQHGTYRIETTAATPIYAPASDSVAQAPAAAKFVILTSATSVYNHEGQEIRLVPGTRLKEAYRIGRNVVFTLEDHGENYSLPDALVKEE